MLWCEVRDIWCLSARAESRIVDNKHGSEGRRLSMRIFRIQIVGWKDFFDRIRKSSVLNYLWLTLGLGWRRPKNQLYLGPLLAIDTCLFVSSNVRSSTVWWVGLVNTDNGKVWCQLQYFVWMIGFYHMIGKGVLIDHCLLMYLYQSHNDSW